MTTDFGVSVFSKSAICHASFLEGFRQAAHVMEIGKMTITNSAMDDYYFACSQVDPNDFYKRGVDFARSGYQKLFDAFPCVARPGVNYIDYEYADRIGCSSLKLRLHSNESAIKNKINQSCIIYAHGGGFVGGDLSVVDSLSNDFVHDLGVKVAAINYRLAPEHQNPSALEDCFDAYRYIYENAEKLQIDPNSIYFAGESCGGSFAIGVSMLLRDRGVPQIAGAIAINPVLDLHRWALRQVDDEKKDFCDEMHFFTSNYLGDIHSNYMKDYTSPLLMDNLEKLPPILMWAARSDPLSKEVEAMSARLSAINSQHIVQIQDDAVHGYLRARYHYKFAHQGYNKLLECIKELMRLDRSIPDETNHPKLDFGQSGGSGRSGLTKRAGG